MAWLGEMPAHWEVGPYKRFVDIQNGADHKHIETDEGYPVIGSGGPFAFASDYMFDGESVLLGRKGTIDRPLFVSGRFWVVDTMYWTKVAANADARFAYYTALTIPFGLYSTNTALPSMTKSALSAHRVAIPPLAEQRAIAAFLDRETAKIDALVAEQRRLMDLLREKRQAVISHAVTKGLNPDAPMKDSGVEWLGEVPSHWAVAPLKRVIGRIDQGGSPQCESWPAHEDEWGVLKVGAVNTVRLNEREQKALPAETAPLVGCEVQHGDILLSRGNTLELVGMASLAIHPRAKLLLSDLIYRFRPRGDAAVGEFIVRSLRTPNARWQIESAAVGTSPSMKKISQGDVRELKVAVPPIQEQQEIISALEEFEAQQQQLCAEVEKSTALLLERRYALITAAVTGQIDVRGLAVSEAA